MDQAYSNQSTHAGADPLVRPVTASPVVDAEISPAKNPRGISGYQGLPVYALLQHAAEQLPDRVAAIYGQKRWSFKKLNDDSIRAAALLQQMGVQPGDRVGLLLPNVPEYIIAANAVWRAGGIVVAISPLMVAREIEALAKKTGMRLIVCLDMLSQNVLNPDVKLLLVSIREHLPSTQQVGYLWKQLNAVGQWLLPTNKRIGWFWEQIESCDQNWQPVAIDAEHDTAFILPTGGTTGTPKPVALSHTNMVANAWQQYEWTRQSFGKETMLAVIPFFHSYGMSATLLGSAAMAATVILHHRFQTQKIVQLLEQHQPSVFHAVPAMLSALNERFDNRQPNIHGLKWVISGGCALDAKVAADFSRHTGALVVEGYGLSEASPVTHVGHLFRDPVYGTIGYPLPETECRIVDIDDSTHEVGDGNIGELLIRGPQVMQGYWNDPETTDIAIQDGWLYTGDLAMRDENGIHRIVGREKDLIITNGFNVYPSEVEDVLNQCDGVAEAAVIGVPDERRGEIVKAVVVMKKGVGFDRETLQQHCDEHLSKYKRPREYEHRSQPLPRNIMGKLLRYQLEGER